MTAMEEGTKAGRDAARRARELREARAGWGRGFRVRSPGWVLLGLLVAIALGVVYFTRRTPDDTERGFPNYMQDVER